MAQYDINWSATLSASVTTLAPGTVVCPTAAHDGYVVATTANLAAVGYASGIALTAASPNGAFALQYSGEVPASLTNLGIGAVAAVRVSTAGTLERIVTTPPAPTDYIVGDCSADGTLKLSPVSFVNPPVSGLTVQNGGVTTTTTATKFNFTGAGVIASGTGATATVSIPGLTVKDEGSPLPSSATALDFVGGGVTVSGTGQTKTVDVPAGYVPLLALPGTAPFLVPASPPAAASFAKTNLLGATLTDNASTGTLLVTVPGNRAAGGDSRGLAYVTLPATPYTFTIGQVVQRYQATTLAGIFIGDSAGKIIELATYHNTGDGKVHLLCNKLTNTTTESAAYTDIASHVSPGAPLFLSIVDHGAGNNLDFRFSYDGINFINFEIRTRNDFLGTIDKVGLIFDDATVVSSHGTVLFEDVFHWVLG